MAGLRKTPALLRGRDRTFANATNSADAAVRPRLPLEFAAAVVRHEVTLWRYFLLAAGLRLELTRDSGEAQYSSVRSGHPAAYL